MRETIRFAGKNWYRHPEASNPYRRIYYRGYPAPRRWVFLHRYIWELANGPIPDEYEVHHVDGNPSNNVLENLAIVSHQEHIDLHWKMLVGKTCEHCGQPFECSFLLRDRQRFCSNACKSAWRRAQKLDHEERICPVCFEPFMVNHYSKKQCCSRLCAQRSRRSREAARLQSDSG